MEEINDLGTKPKTLGISIPTYKRPDFLKKCILSAIKYSNNIPIQIFVVDDSLSNTNDSVIDELTHKYDFIHYTKNTVNLGIDKNISACIDICSCDYSWVIGEDDVFLPGSIERVYNAIQKGNYEFIFSNYSYADENHGVINNVLNNFNEGEFDVKEFISKNLWAIGFIGACVINKDAWMKTSPTPYEGSYYTHVGRIVDMIANSNYIYALKEPNVANRSKGADTFTWKNDSFGVFLGFEAMCKAVAKRNLFLAQIMDNAINVFRTQIGYFSLQTLLRLRAEQLFDQKQFKKYILDIDISPVKKKIFHVIAITPIFILKPFLYLYRALKKTEKIN